MKEQKYWEKKRLKSETKNVINEWNKKNSKWKVVKKWKYLIYKWFFRVIVGILIIYFITKVDLSSPLKLLQILGGA